MIVRVVASLALLLGACSGNPCGGKVCASIPGNDGGVDASVDSGVDASGGGIGDATVAADGSGDSAVAADGGADAWVDGDVDMICVPLPPRPIAPLSTATVTTQQPTLRWKPAPSLSGGHVDICADRACTVVEQTIDTTGSSGGPAVALPSGVHYWRVRAPGGSLFSPTWEFWVGARSTSVDTSWGATLDVNGDGYADVVVGAPGVSGAAGRAYIYLGSASGLATTPATTLTGPDGANGQFGGSVASAGDVNGDGFADLVVGASAVSGRTGRAYLYLGSATGLATTPATTLTGPDGANGQFGGSVASAGDVNGDGFADVVIGANTANGWIGRAYVYLGSASGLATTPTTLTGLDGMNGVFGGSVASAGDVNGDGFADLVVGAIGASGNTGRAYVFLGSASGPSASPWPTLTGPDGMNGYFGGTVASAGDVNGDGFADLVVTAPGVSTNTGRAYVYLGSASGPSPSPAATLTGPDGVDGFFGQSGASAGDLNGDGFADLVVGAYCAPYVTSCGAGRAYVYLGSASGPASSPAPTLTGPDGGYFGISVAGAGDVNGDGFADLLVGAYGTSNDTGNAYLYLGSGPGPSPSPSLIGPDGADGNFGVSVE